MLPVDDLAVIGVRQRILAQLLLDLPHQLGDQRVVHAALHQNVVGRHAGLPAVQKLAEHDALSGQRQVRARIHDAGALAAQLKHGGRQVFRCMAQHFLAHVLTSGEEDEVELLLQQCRVFRASAFHHGHVLGCKAFLNDRADHRTGGRRVGARLQDGRVARGDGVGQWVDGQKEGVVPRAHDERVAVGDRLREAP